MKLIDYKKKYGVGVNRMASLVMMYYPKMINQIRPGSGTYKDPKQEELILQLEVPEVKEDLDVLKEMYFLNNMVKNPDCPGNIRNQFYVFKKRIIQKLLHTRRITSAEYQGDFILLTVDNGSYEFHQPTAYYRNFGLDKLVPSIKQGEPYVRPQRQIVPVDLDRYKDWKNFIIAFNVDGCGKNKPYFTTK